MSDQDDLNAFDTDVPTPDEPAPWADEVTDDPAVGGWSPVMGTPPPNAEPIVDDVDTVPPHEQADDGMPPPAPEPTGEGDGISSPPPAPAADGDLPPALPEAIDDPVDLSGAGPALEEAPMPPIGDVDTTTPPPAGEVDLGTDGPPIAPDVPSGDGGVQSPVPDMGGQNPVPEMGNAPVTGDVDLGTDGAPMPAIGDVDTTTAPPGTDTGEDVLLPHDGIGDAPTEPAADELMSVELGQERVTAAALTGAFLDQMEMDDPARERMIDLLTERAGDGTITTAELYEAFDQAGFDTTETNGSEETLVASLHSSGPHTALVRVDGEGLGLFRISENGGVVELESLQTGFVYEADRPHVAEAWRESGSRVISAPEPITTKTTSTTTTIELAADEPEEKADADGSDNRLRNVFVAGAVLLPLAGGAAYLTTRKVR